MSETKQTPIENVLTNDEALEKIEDSGALKGDKSVPSEQTIVNEEDSIKAGEGVNDQYSKPNSPFKSTEKSTVMSVETPMDHEICQITKEIDSGILSKSTPVENTTLEVLQIAPQTKDEVFKDSKLETTCSLQFLPVKGSGENFSFPEVPKSDTKQNVAQPPLESSLVEIAEIYQDEFVPPNEPNEEMGSNITGSVQEIKIADNAETELFKERNEDLTGINSELHLESTLIEIYNNEEITVEVNSSKSRPLRSSFSEHSFGEADADTLSNHVSYDQPIETAQLRRSAIIESFSPISKTNNTSQDASFISNKMEHIISGNSEGDALHREKSLKIIASGEHEETSKLDITEETEAVSIMASSYVIIKTSNSSSLVSPIDTSPNVFNKEASDAIINSAFLSPTTNPLNQTFKLLPEPDSSTADEDSDNLSEVIERKLMTDVLNDVKSPGSVYYDCFPNSFHERGSLTHHGHFENDKLRERLVIDVQEVAEAIDVRKVDLWEKIQKLSSSSSADSGTELDKSPGLTNDNLSPHGLLKDISGYHEKYTGSNVVSTPNDKNESDRSKCQTLTTASLEDGTRPVSDTVPYSFSSAQRIQSQLETKLEITPPSMILNSGYNGMKFKYFEDLSESEALDELHVDTNTASAILQDDSTDIKDVLVSSVQNGHCAEQLMAVLPLKDKKVPKQYTAQANPCLIKEGKPQIPKKPNPSITQGRLYAKQAAKPQAKTSVVVTKKPSIAGGKALVKPTSSQVIPKKETEETASSKPVTKKPSQTARVAPMVKPTFGSRAPPLATASSRITSASTSGGLHGSASLLPKPSAAKSVVSSTSTKLIGSVQPISKFARTATQSTRQPQKQVDPLKSFMTIAQKVSPLPSPTDQRRQVSTSQGLKKNPTQASSKPASAQTTSKPTSVQATSKPTATVAAKRFSAKPDHLGNRKTKVNHDT